MSVPCISVQLVPQLWLIFLVGFKASADRKLLLKGKAQYSWPPCTNLFTLDAFDIEKIIFYKKIIRRLTVLTEPSPSVSVPCTRCRYFDSTSLPPQGCLCLSWGNNLPLTSPPEKLLQFRGLGMLKGEVSLYHWSPVWLVWNQLQDNWQFVFICKNRLIQTRPVEQEVNGTVILPPLVSLQGVIWRRQFHNVDGRVTNRSLELQKHVGELELVIKKYLSDVGDGDATKRPVVIKRSVGLQVTVIFLLSCVYMCGSIR